MSLIQNGDRSKFDVEILKQLIKLLPEKHEVRVQQTISAIPHTNNRKNLWFVARCLFEKICYICVIHCLKKFLDLSLINFGKQKSEVSSLYICL